MKRSLDIRYNDHQFSKALKSYFDVAVENNIVVYRDGTCLGGCGFTYSSSTNTAYAFILRLYPNWVSKQFYYKLLRYPFDTFNCDKCIARVKKDNIRSHNVCRHLGGVQDENGDWVFDKQRTLQIAEETFKS